VAAEIFSRGREDGRVPTFAGTRPNPSRRPGGRPLVRFATVKSASTFVRLRPDAYSGFDQTRDAIT
jgi:hypothetical protein